MSVERRASPRYPVNFTVQVRPVGIEQDFSIAATMLSRTSMQATCEADLVTALVKQAQAPYVCALTFITEPHMPAIQAQVLTHRRVSQQHYVLVFLFKSVTAQQDEALQGLLQDKVPPHMA